MFSSLKALFGRGAAKDPGIEDAAPAEAVEYKGFRIRPAPFKAKSGQFQTAGVIEKEFPSGLKRHEFIRAETHPSRDEAESFAIAKAKRIVDEQGDRMFREPG